MHHILDPKWELLKALSDSKFAKLTILVPVIGWFLLYNENILSILDSIPNNIADASGNKIEKGGYWRIHTFYIGLFLVSISAILFIIFCPDEIKNYSSSLNYIELKRKTFTELEDGKISNELNIDPIEWTKPSPTRAITGTKGEHYLNYKQSVNEEKIIDQLEKIYCLRNSSRPIIRKFTLLIFTSGSLIASVPAISTSLSSLSYVYSVVRHSLGF